MYLLDTNIWLELLLAQSRAAEVRRFLENIYSHQLAMTDFTLYSIGIILTHLGRGAVFADFLADTVEVPGFVLIRLEAEELRELVTAARQYQLGFDDAYQYVAARRRGCRLLSFDADFDRTDIARATPAEIVPPA